MAEALAGGPLGAKHLVRTYHDQLHGWAAARGDRSDPRVAAAVRDANPAAPYSAGLDPSWSRRHVASPLPHWRAPSQLPAHYDARLAFPACSSMRAIQNQGACSGCYRCCCRAKPQAEQRTSRSDSDSSSNTNVKLSSHQASNHSSKRNHEQQ